MALCTQVILYPFLPTNMALQNHRKACYLYTVTSHHEITNTLQMTFKN